MIVTVETNQLLSLIVIVVTSKYELVIVKLILFLTCVLPSMRRGSDFI